MCALEQALRLTAVGVLVGCSGGLGGGGAGPDPDDWTPPDHAAADEALLREAIAGEVDAAEALATIARRGGLPIEAADGTYLFACLCGDGAWRVGGDFNGWTGGDMTQAGDLWWLAAEVPVPDGSRYKLVNGYDDDTWMSDPVGRRFAWDDFGELSLVREDDAHLERFYAFADDAGALAPRDLQVWVPEGGDYTHLLVAHDGQNLFDPHPAPPATSWHLDQSLPDDMLVVGIDNTADRFDEYTHVADRLSGTVVGGGAATYGAFVEATVRPFVEAHYGPPEVRGMLGSSLGGLVSLVIPQDHPGVYDMALSMSGMVGWGSIGQDGPTVVDRHRELGHQDTAIYIDSGGGGACYDADGDGVPDDDLASSDNYCENGWYRDVLASELGYAFDTDLWHWHEAGAAHGESAWSARVWRPLELFGDR